MQKIKSQEQIKHQLSEINVYFQQANADVNSSDYLQQLYELRQKVIEIVSTLKQQTNKLVDDLAMQVTNIKQQKRKSQQQKDEIIKSLRSEIFQLKKVENQLKTTFDQAINKRDQQIQFLHDYILFADKNTESSKLLFSQNKEKSLELLMPKQYCSQKQSFYLDVQTKASIGGITPSISAISNRSSDRKYQPLKSKYINTKALKRSQNVKSVLSLIAKINNNQLKTKIY